MKKKHRRQDSVGVRRREQGKQEREKREIEQALVMRKMQTLRRGYRK